MRNEDLRKVDEVIQKVYVYLVKKENKTVEEERLIEEIELDTPLFEISEEDFITVVIDKPIFDYLSEEELWGAEVTKVFKVKYGEVNSEYEVIRKEGVNLYIIEDIKF